VSQNIHPSAKIHPSAIISDAVNIAEGVEVGPFTLIEGEVSIGPRCKIASHVVIKGHTEMGADNEIYQFTTVGENTPDLKYKGEDTYLKIGNGNVFRECVTLHRGTVQDKNETLIGDNNLLMAYTQVAHDCVLGNRNIIANGAQLAGHVELGDGVIIGGLVGITQFRKLFNLSMCTANAALNKDVPAYVTVSGNMAKAAGLNLVGMQRNGFSSERIGEIKTAYKLLYRQGLTLAQALDEIKALPKSPEMDHFIHSIEASDKGIVRP
jgi:UDP-N-acetylglucosamine acyltransferase